MLTLYSAIRNMNYLSKPSVRTQNAVLLLGPPYKTPGYVTTANGLHQLAIRTVSVGWFHWVQHSPASRYHVYVVVRAYRNKCFY